MLSDETVTALKPYGYEWPLSVTGISGPGSIIVVFATAGDFLTAALTHGSKVVWVMGCAGSEIEAYSEQMQGLCQTTRQMYHHAHP